VLLFIRSYVILDGKWPPSSSEELSKETKENEKEKMHNATYIDCGKLSSVLMKTNSEP